MDQIINENDLDSLETGFEENATATLSNVDSVLDDISTEEPQHDELVNFLTRILPENGFYFRIVNKWSHVAYDDVSELAAGIRSSDTSGSDVHYAVSAFRDRFVKRKHQGKNDTIHRRVNENVLAVKSFWLDIDVGEGKNKVNDKGKAAGYDTTADAEVAFRKFIADTKLPAPSITVSSGSGGLHVYWILDRSIQKTEWKNTADALKELCHKNKFWADPSRTADATSVLRPIGTTNKKTSPGKPVSLIEDNGSTFTIDEFRGVVSTAAGRVISAGDSIDAFPPLPDNIKELFDIEAPVSSSDYENKSVERLWLDKLNHEEQFKALDDALSAIPGDEFSDHDSWRNIGFALQSCTHLDNNRLYKLFLKHSMRDPYWGNGKRSEEEVAARWPGLEEPHTISVDYLLTTGIDYGWIIPSGTTTQDVNPVQAEEFYHIPTGLVPGGRVLRVLNERYFVADWGPKTSIIYEEEPGLIHRKTREEFSLRTENLIVKEKKRDGDDERFKADIWWRKHQHRRQYSKVVFKPDGSHRPHEYNLWRDLALTPQQGGWSKLRWHLWHVICRRNQKVFRYLIQWMAMRLQKPGTRAEVAVVMRSAQEGTGKGTVGNWMMDMIGKRHALKIDDKNQLVGNFNARLEYTTFLFLDEPVWAGDKSAERKFKSLITEPTYSIEPKGVDSYAIDNRLSIMMASNSEWVIPAGNSARRFLMLDINPEYAQNNDYFEPLHVQAENGGLEAMMHFLMNLDISKFKHRKVPKTRALAEQQVMSLESVDRWLYDCSIMDSATPNAAVHGGVQECGLGRFVSTTEVYKDYQDWCKYNRVRFPESMRAFGKRLKVVVSHRRQARRQDAKTHHNYTRGKTWGYDFPDKATLSSNLARECGISVTA